LCYQAQTWRSASLWQRSSSSDRVSSAGWSHRELS
jgi:hypothetical protein